MKSIAKKSLYAALPLLLVAGLAAPAQAAVTTLTPDSSAVVTGFPGDVAFDGNRTYVSTYEGNVDVIRGGALIKSIPVAESVSALAVDSVDSTLYATIADENRLAVIRNDKVVKTLDVGGYPVDMFINAATRTVYVLNVSSATVSVVQGENLVGQFPVQQYTQTFAFDPTTQRIFATRYVPVQAINALDEYSLDGTLLRTTTVPAFQAYVNVEHATGIAYVTQSTRRSSVVSAVKDGVVLSSTPIAPVAEGATLNQANGKLFVSAHGWNAPDNSTEVFVFQNGQLKEQIAAPSRLALRASVAGTNKLVGVNQPNRSVDVFRAK